MGTKRMKAPFNVGDKVRYIDSSTYLKEDGETPILSKGDVGVVTETHEGYDAHIKDFGAGPEEVGPLHDWNVVKFPSGFKRAVTADALDRYELAAKSQ